MKRIVIHILTLVIIFFTSCTGLKTTTTGLNNEAFIEIIGKPSQFSGGVDVKIDDKLNFKAQVKKDKDIAKGSVYAISTGNHTIVISYNGNMIFRKQIFVSSQETRKIILQ